MSNSKPIPLYHRADPQQCPVCGRSSYSASGVHPQCCVRSQDADRMQRLKQAQALAAKPVGNDS